MAPFRLKDTLPVTLESLTFYGDEGLARIKDLGEQLSEVVRCGHFPFLRSVVLEKVPKDVLDCYADQIELPYQEVEQACREQMVEFRVVRDSDLLKGGRHLPYFERSAKARRRWERKDSNSHWEHSYSESSESSLDDTTSDELDSDEPGLDDLDTDSDELDSDELDSNGLDSNGLDSDGLDSDGLDSDELDSDELSSDDLDSDSDELDSDDLDSDELESSDMETGPETDSD